MLIESGSRYLAENFLPGLYDAAAEGASIDLVTCYPGQPAGFREERGRIYRVYEFVGAKARKELYRQLLANHYAAVGMICSAEPIMTKWKWALAFRLPAKVFIINENGDHFWLDCGQWRTVSHFVLFRAGLTGTGAVRTVVRLLVFPFVLAYLLIYAAAVHIRRKVRE